MTVVRFPEENTVYTVDFISAGRLPFRTLRDSYYPDWIDSIKAACLIDQFASPATHGMDAGGVTWSTRYVGGNGRAHLRPQEAACIVVEINSLFGVRFHFEVRVMTRASRNRQLWDGESVIERETKVLGGGNRVSTWRKSATPTI